MIGTVRVDRLTGGDPAAYARFLCVLRAQEQAGVIKVLSVSESLARVRVLDQRLMLILSEEGDHARAQ